MPELSFQIRWPDGAEEWCYSPSTVVADYLAAGETYALPDFLVRCRAALSAASDRVDARHGHRCARAEAQLAAIETRAAGHPSDSAVEIACLAARRAQRGVPDGGMT